MEFLEIPVFDDDVYKMFIRFAFDLFFLALIVRYAIFPAQQDREFAFTVSMLNITVFFICFTLKKLELQLGMASACSLSSASCAIGRMRFVSRK